MSYRAKVTELAAYLAAKNIGKADPEYFNITEGRTDWVDGNGTRKTYSWCGDFVTYVLTRAGATEKQWLNRKENNGKWEIGRNIIMLVEGAKARGGMYSGAQAYSRLMTNQPGDILIISGNNGQEHVCLLKTVVDERTYVTYDGNGTGGRTCETLRTLPKNAIRYALNAEAFVVEPAFPSLVEPTTTVDPYEMATSLLAQANGYANPPFILQPESAFDAVVEAGAYVVGELAMYYDEYFNEGDDR